MQDKKPTGRLGRRGKIAITLAGVFGTLALLLYLEQLAIIYIGTALALIVLLIVVAFSDLEHIRHDAEHEVYAKADAEEVLPLSKVNDTELARVSRPVSLTYARATRK